MIVGNKGVSPIIAMVLVVLITISLTGAFLVWSQRTATQLTERGTEQQQRFVGQFSKGVQIISADCSQATGSDFIYVKNSGATTWRASDLRFFVNDTLNASAITFDNVGNIVEGGVLKATFGQALEQSYRVRVIFQEVSDSTVCK